MHLQGGSDEREIGGVSAIQLPREDAVCQRLKGFGIHCLNRFQGCPSEGRGMGLKLARQCSRPLPPKGITLL